MTVPTANEAGQRDEWGSYVALDTWISEETRDCPQAERLRGNGGLIVVAGVTTSRGCGESPQQGEADQAKRTYNTRGRGPCDA